MYSSNLAGSTAARQILCLCLFASIFSEVLLSPFYPQFFEKVFSINGMAFTGVFIFSCRLAVMISTPVWGKLSQKISTTKLFLVALGSSPVLTGALAFAQTPIIFLIITVLMLTMKSSLLLIYPLLTETYGASSMSRRYQFLFHGAVISGSVCGAFVMMLDNPIRIFLLMAGGDVFLFSLVWRMKDKLPAPVKPKKHKQKIKSSRIGMPLMVFFLFGTVVFAFHLGNNIIRPYFTLFTEHTFYMPSFTSSLLFLLPNAVALLFIPWMHKWVTKDSALGFSIVAVFMLVITLFLQWGVSMLWIFIIARALYGIFLASGQAAMEASFFQSQNNGHASYTYSLLLLFQNAAMLSAPLTAAYLTEAYGLSFSFLSAAIILMGALAALYHLAWGERKIERKSFSYFIKRKEDIT